MKSCQGQRKIYPKPVKKWGENGHCIVGCYPVYVNDECGKGSVGLSNKNSFHIRLSLNYHVYVPYNLFLLDETFLSNPLILALQKYFVE